MSSGTRSGSKRSTRSQSVPQMDAESSEEYNSDDEVIDDVDEYYFAPEQQRRREKALWIFRLFCQNYYLGEKKEIVC